MTRTRVVDRVASIARLLAEQGYCVLPDALPGDLLGALIRDARTAWDGEEYRAARVGSGGSRHLAPAIRSDRILWFDQEAPTPAQRAYLDWLERLRLEINQHTFMGLFEWEGHFACYPPGSAYVRHLDVFADARQRQVSTVLYLNEAWQRGDGGELRIWTDPAGPDWQLDSPTIDIEPRAGTLVLFLSEDYYHEVLPSRADRFSVTGWFRTR